MHKATKAWPAHNWNMPWSKKFHVSVIHVLSFLSVSAEISVSNRGLKSTLQD